MSRRACALAAGVVSAVLSGCGASAPVSPDETYTPSMVVIDGSVHEWPEEAALLADERYLYFRASLPEAEHALQAAPFTLAIWLDLDSSVETGVVREAPGPASGLGIDLEILFSPPQPNGTPGSGVAINAIDASGGRTLVGHAEVDFMFSPTFASAWYEGRLSRSVADLPALAGVSGERVTGMYVVLENGAPTNMWSDPITCVLPGRVASEGAYAVIPEREEGTLRVMSWNVLRDAPVENAAPFARVIDAVDADVILFQEWDYSAPQFTGWFTALIEARRWHALSSEAWGVSIVSKHPLESLGSQLEIGGREVRFVAGIASTPAGPLAVGSAHLTCCGGANSEEDARRGAEARAISESMREWLADSGVTMTVIGGDINLVGTRGPLEALGAGLDADGSDLEVATTYVLGDSAQYTWTDAGNPFTPGRLDYLLSGESGAEIVRAFAIDTSRLQEEALGRMGLKRSDTSASDHLPIVIDIRPR